MSHRQNLASVGIATAHRARAGVLLLLALLLLSFTGTAHGHAPQAGSAGENPGVVFWDTEYFLAGQNPADVAVADFNGDGHPDVAAADEASGNAYVLLNQTAPHAVPAVFANAKGFLAGANPNAIAAGDVNRDGKPDLIVVSPTQQLVAVLVNTTAAGAPKPSFATGVTFGTLTDPGGVAVGDLNRDGLPDLVVSDGQSSRFSVFVNATASGAATPVFRSRQDFDSGDSGGNKVLLADFNADSAPDVAVVHNGLQSGNVTVMLNHTGAGSSALSFLLPQMFAVGSGPMSGTVGDFNSDGLPDLAVGTLDSETIAVLLNRTKAGASTAQFSRQDIAMNTPLFAVAVGDFTGDGKPDLAAVDDESVWVLKNRTPRGAGAAEFAAPASFAGNLISLAVGDFNMDGELDLAGTQRQQSSNQPGSAAVLLNGATLRFATQTIATGFAPSAVAAGDFNRDGKPDIAVTNAGLDNVGVLMNTTPSAGSAPAFAAQVVFGVGVAPGGVAVGDMNGDKKPDLVVGNISSDDVSVLLNTTPKGAAVPSFAPEVRFAAEDGAGPLALNDYNKDGKLDIAVANVNSSYVSVLLNTTAPGATTPSFASKVNFNMGGAEGVASGDFNKDGMPDLAATGSLQHLVYVMLNTAEPGATTPSFGTPTWFDFDGKGAGVAVADFNKDARPDLAVANAYRAGVFLNQTVADAQTPDFTLPRYFGTGDGATGTATGDFDGDGQRDIVVTNAIANSVSFLINATGTGAQSSYFAPHQDFDTGKEPSGVAVADWNKDGKRDIVVANTGSDAITVFWNRTP